MCRSNERWCNKLSTLNLAHDAKLLITCRSGGYPCVGIYCKAAANSFSSRVKDDPSLSLMEISLKGKVSSFGIPSARETTLFGAEYAILAERRARKPLKISLKSV